MHREAPRPRERVVEAPPDMIPWEHRGKLGPARAFWETLLLSVREPRRFYALVPREESVWGALAYGLVFDALVALVTFAHHALSSELHETMAPLYPKLRELYPEGPELIERITTWGAIGALLFTPLSYVVNLLGTVTFTWVGLKMAGAMKTSYRHLLRMFAYASWIQLFGLLSVTGDVFLGLLSFVLVVGFGSYYWLTIVRETQKITTGQAMVASLFGLLLAFGLSCFIGFPMLLGLAWLVLR